MPFYFTAPQEQLQNRLQGKFMATVFFDWNQTEKLVGFGSLLSNWFIITLNFSKKQVIWTLSEMELWPTPSFQLIQFAWVGWIMSVSSGRASGHLEEKVATCRMEERGRLLLFTQSEGAVLTVPKYCHVLLDVCKRPLGCACPHLSALSSASFNRTFQRPTIHSPFEYVSLEEQI